VIGPRLLTRRSAILGVAALGAAGGAEAASKERENVDTVIASERSAADAVHKGLLLVFFASWCGWCRLMDEFLEETRTQLVIGARFRTLHVRVLETESRYRGQQFEGADAAFRHYAGENMGLPFLVFMNASGQVLTTTRSGITGDNIGFPGTPVEYAWFERMLAQAAPDAAESDRAALLRACMQLNPVH